jgi:hypothetical protein
MADENPDNKPQDEKPEEKKTTPLKKPRELLRKRLKAKFNQASKSEVAEVLKDTAEDLKSNNKERVGLAIATVIPGGWFAYYAHRHHKYKKKHQNDDTQPEADDKQAPPKAAKPPQP